MQEDFGQLTCPCGSENFERVIVRKLMQVDYVTEFIACIHCRVMLHLPSHFEDANQRLKQDAKIAASFYRRPGRP